MGRQKETEDDDGDWAVMRKAEGPVNNKNTHTRKKREIIITKMETDGRKQNRISHADIT